ncbi:Type 1 glutamine amidotransferase-like domain-containing protein [Streptacidiphilus jiangxiensis]|uniref:Cyanophycinase n=1 Tax=Streptacidiphilus jiangxiensis TaxID=235985 RepID=A0A1H7R218_STRJI|nr:Type 1 glutamine amidotransferase-like domain-containing protein [Streptacidiphilus jiangxiensis]SEL54311.1 cyanophycinase [Streptacidiphilus jiangxiensis]
MTTYLIGGGWNDEAADQVYGPFLTAAGPEPVVACLLIDEGDGPEYFARFEAALRKVAPCRPVPVLVPVGGAFDPASLDGADALLVCGGLTPAYQEVLAPVRAEVRSLLTTRNIPYAGFSAGAAVAADAALVGGWLSQGTAICPEETAEDLEEIEVRPGLGLLPFTVEVHAAQWGTLPRLIEAVAVGAAPCGVAIDENTLVTVDGETAHVSGPGRVHVVRAEGPHRDITLRAYRSGETFTV